MSEKVIDLPVKRREIDWDALGASGQVCRQNVETLRDAYVSDALSESQRRGDTIDQHMASSFQSAYALVQGHFGWLERHQAKRDAGEMEHGAWVVALVEANERFWAKLAACEEIGVWALSSMVDATWPDGPGPQDEGVN